MTHGSARSCVRQRCGLLMLAAALVVVGSGSARAQTPQSLRIVPLVRGEQVLVRFDLTDGFTEEVRAAIMSGLKTTYTYTVDLRLAVPGWVDRTIGTVTLANSVEYNNLTRQFTLERRLDGRVEESRVTADERNVRQFMTAVGQMALFRTSMLEPNREYYVRVTASARPSNGSILWPFGSGTSAQTKFTYLR